MDVDVSCPVAGPSAYPEVINNCDDVSVTPLGGFKPSKRLNIECRIAFAQHFLRNQMYYRSHRRSATNQSFNALQRIITLNRHYGYVPRKLLERAVVSVVHCDSLTEIHFEINDGFFKISEDCSPSLFTALIHFVRPNGFEIVYGGYDPSPLKYTIPYASTLSIDYSEPKIYDEEADDYVNELLTAMGSGLRVLHSEFDVISRPQCPALVLEVFEHPRSLTSREYKLNSVNLADLTRHRIRKCGVLVNGLHSLFFEDLKPSILPALERIRIGHHKRRLTLMSEHNGELVKDLVQHLCAAAPRLSSVTLWMASNKLNEIADILKYVKAYLVSGREDCLKQSYYQFNFRVNAKVLVPFTAAHTPMDDVNSRLIRHFPASSLSSPVINDQVFLNEIKWGYEDNGQHVALNAQIVLDSVERHHWQPNI